MDLRRMQYDNAGYLVVDNYTGQGSRSYDAEGLMTSAQWSDGQVRTASYVYDADGRRVKRMDGVGPARWQVYGIDGELLAEYESITSPAAPKKEYAYRAGGLLLTAEARTNHALSASGAIATASSTHPTHSVAALNNGDRKGINFGGIWGDNTPFVYPDWVQIDFPSQKQIDEITVVSMQNNYSTPVEPTDTMTGSTYVITSFEAQYWTGTTWATVPGGVVNGNNLIVRRVTFPAVTTSKIRVVINSTPDNHSQVPELEAWGPSGGLKWFVSDQLGTPRMILDQSGSLAGVTRHDYMPFGEEVVAGRLPEKGYRGDGVRQKFTQKERDNETGLDYFLARYYSAIQGRFTSPDPVFIAIERLRNPQGLNLYNYTLGNPLRYTDPTGMQVFMKCETTEQCQAIVDQLNSRDNAGFRVELKNGEIKVVGGADKVDTSKLSDAEKQLLGAITDPKNIVQLTVRPTSDKLDQILFDKFEGFQKVEGGKNVATHLFDSRDMKIAGDASKAYAGNIIGHAIIEAMVASREKLGPADFGRAHGEADKFFKGLSRDNVKRTNSPDGAYTLNATFVSIGKVVEISVSSFNGGGRVSSVTVQPLEKKK